MLGGTPCSQVRVPGVPMEKPGAADFTRHHLRTLHVHACLCDLTCVPGKAEFLYPGKYSFRLHVSPHFLPSPPKSMLTRPFLIILLNFPVNLSPPVLPTFSGNVSSGQLTSSEWPRVLWVGYFPCWALTWSKRPMLSVVMELASVISATRHSRVREPMYLPLKQIKNWVKSYKRGWEVGHWDCKRRKGSGKCCELHKSSADG